MQKMPGESRTLASEGDTDSTEEFSCLCVCARLTTWPGVMRLPDLPKQWNTMLLGPQNEEFFIPS
jgi:hypothetical protein